MERLRAGDQPEGPVQARLVNEGGELIVEGSCWVDERAGTATLEPEREAGTLQKERGALRLELETGRTLRVSDKPIVFRLRQPNRLLGQGGTRTLYRLRLLPDDSSEPHAIAQSQPAGYRAGVSSRTNGHWPWPEE